MEGWRWGISGSSRPPPAVPVNLAPLTSRRGNPEAADAAPAPPPYRCPNHSLRLLYFLAHTPDFRYCRYIIHAAYLSIAYPVLADSVRP